MLEIAEKLFRWIGNKIRCLLSRHELRNYKHKLAIAVEQNDQMLMIVPSHDKRLI